jgi:hypothetical protein
LGFFEIFRVPVVVFGGRTVVLPPEFGKRGGWDEHDEHRLVFMFCF